MLDLPAKFEKSLGLFRDQPLGLNRKRARALGYKLFLLRDRNNEPPGKTKTDGFNLMIKSDVWMRLDGRSMA
jgi:hypothetical protein